MSALFGAVGARNGGVSTVVEGLRSLVLGALSSGQSVGMAVVGTSVERGQADGNFTNVQVAWPNVLAGLMPQLKLPYFFKRAVGGANYADGGLLGIAEGQLDLALADLDKIKGARVLLVGFGVNDFSGVAATPSAATVKGMVGYWRVIASRCLSAGVLPVFVGPTASSLHNVQEMIAADRLLAAFCEEEGYPYVHILSLMMDARDGTAGWAIAGDGIHPSIEGAKRVAGEVKRVLRGEGQTVSPWLAMSRADLIGTTGLAGLGMGSANGNVVNGTTGVPDSSNWRTATAISTATGSGNMLGHWMECGRDGTETVYTQLYPLTSAATASDASVGDVLRVGFRVSAGVEGSKSGWDVRMQSSSSGAHDIFGNGNQVDIDLPEGIMVVDYKVPAVPSDLRILFRNMSVDVGGGVDGWCRIGSVTGVNLTRLRAMLN